jgi:UrcA family protein
MRMYLSIRKHTDCIAAALGAACALALLPTPGFAREADTRSVMVHYSDLNLNTEAGAAALYSRLVRAARNVCEDPAEVVAIGQMQDIDKCRKETLADAVDSVDRPLLTEVYEEHHPGELYAALPAPCAPARST